jgi:hypothetical protein
VGQRHPDDRHPAGRLLLIVGRCINRPPQRSLGWSAHAATFLTLLTFAIIASWPCRRCSPGCTDAATVASIRGTTNALVPQPAPGLRDWIPHRPPTDQGRRRHSCYRSWCSRSPWPWPADDCAERREAS